MKIYENSMNKINGILALFDKHRKELPELDSRLTDIEIMTDGLSSVSELDGRLKWIMEMYDGLDVSGVDGILSEIEKLCKELKAISKESVSKKLPLDTSSILGGDNVRMDSLSGGNTVINILDGYDVSVCDSSEEGEYSVDVSGGKDFAVVELSADESSEPSVVYVGGTGTKWEAGQSCMLYFTGCKDTGVVIDLGCTSFEVSFDELNNADTVEIICIGEDKFIHLIK